MMKKHIFRIVNLVFIALFICSCSKPPDTVIYYYNDNSYTNDFKYGDIDSFWDFTKDLAEYEWEEIVITSSWGVQESATKFKNDDSIIFIHDILCVRAAIALPDFQNDLADITSIELYFGSDDTMLLSNEKQIRNFIDFYLKTCNNSEPTRDYLFEYVGHVHIYFKDCPLYFSAARILKDDDGNFYLSSKVNPNIESGMFKSLYSLPLKLNF